MKKPSELFKEARERALKAPYQNRFKRGDVIMNVEYGVVSLVVDVKMGTEYKQLKSDFVNMKFEHVAVENSPIQYELKDIKNEKTQKDITRKPSRFQDVKVIDKFYSQVNPDMARLLYGVN